MNKLITRVLIVVVVLTLCVLSILPVEKKLKTGKDLAGGVTLTYGIQIGPGEDRQAVLDRTIETLKRRIDPQGLMEVSIVAAGDNRIEITMPLPNERVKGLKKAYDEKLTTLGLSAIDAGRLNRALALDKPARDAELAAMSKDDVAMAGRLQKAADAYDKVQRLRAELAPLTDPAQIDTKALEIATAEIDLDAARTEVLKSVISPREVRRALALSNKESQLQAPDGTFVRIPSPRETAIARLKADHPGAIASLESILAAHDAFAAERTTLDDPYELVRLLKGSGVLSFRITIKPDTLAEESRLRQELLERGPRNVRSTNAVWLKINELKGWYNDYAQFQAIQADPVGFFKSRGYVVEPYDGEYWMLVSDASADKISTADGSWQVASAGEGRDERGLPNITFQMDAIGAQKLGALTSKHVGDQMAVVLDDQIYTAPNINSAISTSGQIQGSFTSEEIQYVVRVLSAGSLTSKLTEDPLSIESVGPELGADNLRQGFRAGLLALLIVGGFMIAYYFLSGIVAVIALVCTSIIILGIMALNHAAFTMVGIAGVILTFGMAVDANVLIYERIREERMAGNDLKTSVRLGFSKALSSIVDGNITTLIVCIVLATKSLSSQEVRGFGITMGVGVLATLFSGLFITHVVFDIFTNVFNIRKLPMLPTMIPALQRVLTPNINWMKFRYFFYTLSTILVGMGIVLAITRGYDMLDTQFRGGTAVTLDLKPGPDGQPMTMTRAEVEQRVHLLGEGKSMDDSLAPLSTASIAPINPAADGVTSNRFKITTYATDQNAVIDSVVNAFSDVLDIKPALEFVGSDIKDAARAPVFVVQRPGDLGSLINRPGLSTDLSPYVGGVAIVLSDLSPVRPYASLRDRFEAARKSGDYSDTLSRQRELVIIDGDPTGVKSAVLLVKDPSASPFDDAQRFETEVVEREWTFVRETLTTQRTPASVQSVGPAVASDFKAKATASFLVSFIGITIYIWIRFKSFRYSLAALIALLHDVLSVLGLVALAEFLVVNPGTSAFATKLGLMEFKLDLNMVAAMLTVAGYSLNDTVIVMDRIRENRGKLPFATKSMINHAINQTISRTIITSGTTILAAALLYLFGGEGVRAFSFALFCGIFVGTYSSVAVASPLVWSARQDLEYQRSLGRGETLEPTA